MRRAALLAALAVALPLSAQEPYKQLLPINHGLRSPQPESTLPRSAVPVVWPEREPYREIPMRLTPVADGVWRLDDGWQLISGREAVRSGADLLSADSRGAFYNATVPGTVLTTLVAQGVYPDPYFGLNNLAIPDDLCRQDWWYRAVFPGGDLLRQPHQELLLDGINYAAEVWLNGTLLGTVRGAFARGQFDVTGLLREENVLAVHILPPPNPGIPHEQGPAGRGGNGGQLCADGPTFICTEGWDWIPGIRDRNMGLWQAVYLRAGGALQIRDPQVITDLPLPRTDQALLTIRTEVENTGDRMRTAVLRAEVCGVTLEKTVSVAPGQRLAVALTPDEFPALRIDNPALWWPNGYGPQTLHELRLTLGEDDARTIRFGIREFSYEMTVDTPGRKGVRIEYDPAQGDILDHRMLRDVGDGVVVPSLRPGATVREIPDEGMGPYLAIRVNGVRIFCRGGNWGMDDAMKNCSREHLEPYFKLHQQAGFTMIRNWTGENSEEVFYSLADEYGLLVWSDFWLSTEGYNLDVNDEDLFMDNAREVVRRFRNHPSIAIWCPRNEGYAPAGLERRLAAMIAAEDGTRRYHPNSRYCNLKPSGPWTFFRDPADYFRNEAKGFNTEIGSCAVGTAASIRKFMPEEDTWPVSDTWFYHDHHAGIREALEETLAERFGAPQDLDTYCERMQLLNYDTFRAIFEAWNSRMWHNTSGVLLWMTHPAWPSLIWQVYTWDGETAGAYFGCKKACEPLHVQMNLDDRSVTLVNTTREPLSGAAVSATGYTLEGKKVFRMKADGLELPADACLRIPGWQLPEAYLVRLELQDWRGRVLSRNDYVRRTPDNAAEKVRISSRRDGFWELYNYGERIAVGVHPPTDRLPAYWSNGYINLLPGEKRVLEVSYE